MHIASPYMHLGLRLCHAGEVHAVSAYKLVVAIVPGPYVGKRPVAVISSWLIHVYVHV